jgi:hypothetical protein
MMAALHWLVEVVSCLLLLFMCCGCGALTLNSLTDLEDRLTRDGGQGMGNWFVVLYGGTFLAGFVILRVGLEIIGSLLDAWVVA